MKVPYDQELGKLTAQDREHARDLLDDLGMIGDLHEEDVAQWSRKIRYEAVMADREKRVTK